MEYSEDRVIVYPDDYSPPSTSWWCERQMHATCSECSNLPCKCKCHPVIEVTQWCYDDDHEECNEHPDPCECECHPLEEEEE